MVNGRISKAKQRKRLLEAADKIQRAYNKGPLHSALNFQWVMKTCHDIRTRAEKLK